MIVIIPVNGLLNRIRSILSMKLIADTMNEKMCVLWIPEKKICNCHYEDIFGNNKLLWDYVCSEELEIFTKKYDIIPKKVVWFDESNDICTLQGHGKGEQNFIKKFMDSKCSLKIIKTGGNFHDPCISKNVYSKQRMELYSSIVFSNEVTEKVKKVPP